MMKDIKSGKDTDFVDELIFKVINAPTKRMKIEYVEGKLQSRLFLLILRVGGFLRVRLAAHVSNGLKSRIRPVVGRI